MKLQEILKEKLDAIDVFALAKTMGYNNQKKGEDKILTLLEDEYLGLFDNQSSYDMVHTNSSLLKALCQSLLIEESLYEKTIYAIEAIQEDRKNAHYKKIYIHTNFVRHYESVLTMSIKNNSLTISNLYYLQSLPFKSQIQEVSKLVQKHYKTHNGAIEFWGQIKAYLYLYQEKKAPIVFDIDGNTDILHAIKKT